MIPQELIQTSSPSMTSVSSSVNSSGIVVPAGGLQQGNVSMTTINSQVVSGKHVIIHTDIKTPWHIHIHIQSTFWLALVVLCNFTFKSWGRLVVKQAISFHTDCGASTLKDTLGFFKFPWSHLLLQCTYFCISIISVLLYIISKWKYIMSKIPEHFIFPVDNIS